MSRILRTMRLWFYLEEQYILNLTFLSFYLLLNLYLYIFLTLYSLDDHYNISTYNLLYLASIYKLFEIYQSTFKSVLKELTWS